MGKCNLVRIAVGSKSVDRNLRVATASVATQRRRISLKKSFRSATRVLVVAVN